MSWNSYKFKYYRNYSHNKYNKDFKTFIESVYIIFKPFSVELEKKERNAHSLKYDSMVIFLRMKHFGYLLYLVYDTFRSISEAIDDLQGEGLAL